MSPPRYLQKRTDVQSQSSENIPFKRVVADDGGSHRDDGNQPVRLSAVISHFQLTLLRCVEMTPCDFLFCQMVHDGDVQSQNEGAADKSRNRSSHRRDVGTDTGKHDLVDRFNDRHAVENHDDQTADHAQQNYVDSFVGKINQEGDCKDNTDNS